MNPKAWSARSSWLMLAALVVLGCGGEERDPVGPGTAGSTATIDSAGGSLTATLTDGASMTVTIPAGALHQAIEISVQPADPRAGDAAAFTLAPAGLRLARPVTIAIQLPDADLLATSTIVFSQGELTVPVASIVSASAHTVTAVLNTLGLAPSAEVASPTERRVASIRFAAAGNGAVRNVELDQRFQDAVAALAQLQRIGTVAAEDAMELSMLAVLDLDEAAAKADPRFPGLVTDWRTTACGQLDFAISAMESFQFASDYIGLTRVLREVVSWGFAIDDMNALMLRLQVPTCENRARTSVQSRLVELSEPITIDLNQFELSTREDYRSFFKDRIAPLLSISAALSAALFNASADLVKGLLIQQANRLRQGGFINCAFTGTRSQDLQTFLLDEEYGSAVFAVLSPYDTGRLEEDIEYCGMHIEWDLVDSTGIQRSLGRVGRGPAPGEVQLLDTVAMGARDTLRLGGDLQALLCPAPLSANNEQLIIEASATPQNFQLIGQLTPTGDNRYLPGSRLALTRQQLLDAAGLPDSAGGIVHLRFRRTGGVCAGVFHNVAHHTLGQIEIDLDRFEILTDTLPTAHKGLEYHATLQATGGAGAIWAVDDDESLPDGLSLDANGVLSGIPTAAGEFGMRLKATSGGASVIKQFVIKVDVPDLSGTWNGTFSVRLGSGGTAALSVRMVLTQDADHVAGTWFVDNVHQGLVFGFVDSWTLVSGTMSMDQEACSGLFSGSATLLPGANEMSGDFEGRDCHNNHEGGIIHISR